MTQPRYETTFGRAAFALLAVAICGAAYLAILALTDENDFFALVAAAYLGLGSLLLAVPVWWLLHRLGQRTPIHAAICGAILCLVSYIVVFASLGAIMMLESAMRFSIAGGLAGLAAWRIAYRAVRNEN